MTVSFTVMGWGGARAARALRSVRLSRSETRFWGLSSKFPDRRTGRHSICDDPSMPLSVVTALVRNL
ncbi:hypothetical protein ACFXPY_49220, partial [Streptomyces sp. NPDC059153]|uniref:hypothetical protein n=1 Tax=Streptomyces sp. NPDC059153 TaxID=3346743 RepID=UPI0036CC7A66